MTDQAGETLEESQGSRSVTSVLLPIFGYLLTLGLHFVVLVAAIFATVSCGELFRAYFDQMQLELPPPTQLAIIISRNTTNYWYLLIFPGMAIDAAVLALLSYYSPRKISLATGYSHGCLLSIILLLAFFLVALSFPIRSLYEWGEQDEALPAEVETQ